MSPKEVFLSHSSNNRVEATNIAKTIRAHDVPVWYSQTNIMAADIWLAEIGKALERCDWFVVLLSNAAINSIWVQRELNYALTHNQYEHHILPAVIEPCNYEQLSWTLGGFQMVDYSIDRIDAFTQMFRTWGIGFDRILMR